MNYSQFIGDYFIIRKPQREGLTLISLDLKTIPVTCDGINISGINKKSGEVEMKKMIECTDLNTFIFCRTEEEAIKTKLKEINKLKNNIESYLHKMLSDMDSDLKKVDYYNQINMYPELLI